MAHSLRRRSVALVLAVLASAPGLVLAQTKAPVSAVERIRNAGVLRVGVLAQAPWALQDRAGQWMGFDIEMAQRLAADLGVRAEFQRVSWPNASHEVATGAVDIVGGLWPDPRRALEASFSASYATVQVALVAARTKAAQRPTLADYDHPDVTLGVLDGGLSQQVAAERFPRARLLRLDDPVEPLRALGDGRIDALVSRTPVPELLLQLDPQRVTLPGGQPLATRSEAFAVARGDTAWLNYLDVWLRAAAESGWLAQQRAYWFGGLDWQSRL